MQSISDSVLPDVSIEPSSPSLQTIVKKDLSAVSVARASFVNHRSITRRSDNIIRYDGSYGTETVSSPRYRELRCERELKRLQSQQTETEEQLVRMESELRESKFKVESLMEEVTTKKARIRDMEINEKLYQRTLEEMETKSAMMSKQLEQLQRHYEIQKERLITYKTSEEKWEETRANLDEALYSKNNAITLLERELRDVKDELANCLQGMKNAELDISRMQRENEELKRIAESERKDYQASIADWRCRFEKAEAENLITSATSVERNAAMALEMREKIDEAQRLQNLLDEEKRTTQEREKELSRVFQERAEALECTIADGQRTIEDLRDQLVILTEDKDRLENEKIQIGDIMERKTEVLREALLIMDGMHDEVSSLTRSYLEEREQNDGVNGGDNPDPYSDLLHVMSIVETYCRQFENLELRLAVDDHELCKNIRGTDLTETVNDLQYRLFAADQKRAAFEKERREMEHCMKQLQKSESEVKSENVLLKEKTSNLQEECAQLKEETENLRSSVLELKQEITSKAYKISEISEALEESIAANVHHAEVLSNVECNFTVKIESMRNKEILRIHECEELRLDMLKKDEEIKALNEKISELKDALESFHKTGDARNDVQGWMRGSINTHDGTSDDAKQKGDDSFGSSDYVDASEDFPVQHNAARKFLDLTSIYKIRMLKAESKLDY